MSEELTPREVARTRLLARAQGIKASDLLPHDTGEIPADGPTMMALADEFEAIAIGLLALIEVHGGDGVESLQRVFVVLDERQGDD